MNTPKAQRLAESLSRGPPASDTPFQGINAVQRDNSDIIDGQNVRLKASAHLRTAGGPFAVTGSVGARLSGQFSPY